MMRVSWNGRPAARLCRVVLIACRTAVVLAASALCTSVMAHEGHVHADDPPVVSGVDGLQRPQRLDDGSVWLPKISQRQIGLRTAVVAATDSRRAIELPGEVMADPDAAARVQATLAGRIEPAPRGLPAIGQRVARGQVLAVVRATVDPLSQASHRALLAELSASRDLASKRVARLNALSDTVPRRDIEAAESELASVQARLQALSAATTVTEVLTAPVAGVISRADVLTGQVVQAREVLFEIIDPTRLRIEASTFEPALSGEVVDASVSIQGRAVPLVYAGAGRQMRGQALPLAFRARGAELAGLAVGQSVPVTVRVRDTVRGMAVPAAALVRNAANETVVWVKTAPERFEPRRVVVAPLDGARWRVAQGLAAGDRVVTESAALLAQVR